MLITVLFVLFGGFFYKKGRKKKKIQNNKKACKESPHSKPGNSSSVWGFLAFEDTISDCRCCSHFPISDQFRIRWTFTTICIAGGRRGVVGKSASLFPWWVVPMCVLVGFYLLLFCPPQAHAGDQRRLVWVDSWMVPSPSLTRLHVLLPIACSRARPEGTKGLGGSAKFP